jgi:hypothetical protein
MNPEGAALASRAERATVNAAGLRLVSLKRCPGEAVDMAVGAKLSPARRTSQTAATPASVSMSLAHDDNPR